METEIGWKEIVKFLLYSLGLVEYGNKSNNSKE
jgi:hypothetical protein